MRVAALQHDIVWEDRAATLSRLAPQVSRAAAAGAHLVALTEMFATGFSMRTHLTAEAPDGPTATWMHEQAAEHGVWIAGSVALRTDPPAVADASTARGTPEPGAPNALDALDASPAPDAPDAPPASAVRGDSADGVLASNAFLLVGPDGTRYRYDKVHPFSYAGEHERFRPGSDPVVAEVEGVRIGLSVCYDLRFADLYWDAERDVHLELIVANWPDGRRHHWRTLLDARAIEGQVYVVGVNRVGTGGKLGYAGDSRIVDPMGEVLAAGAGAETMLLADIEPSVVDATRARYPFRADR